MNLQHVLPDYFMRAKDLRALGFSYAALYRAYWGGVLRRWVSPKTRHVYYQNRNLTLF